MVLLTENDNIQKAFLLLYDGSLDCGPINLFPSFLSSVASYRQCLETILNAVISHLATVSIMSFSDMATARICFLVRCT